MTGPAIESGASVKQWVWTISALKCEICLDMEKKKKKEYNIEKKKDFKTNIEY